MQVRIHLFDQLSTTTVRWKLFCCARAYITMIDEIDKCIINHLYNYSTSTDPDPPRNRNVNVFLLIVVWTLTPIRINFRRTCPSDSIILTRESLRDWGAVWRIFYTFCTTNFSAFLITSLFLHLLFLLWTLQSLIVLTQFSFNRSLCLWFLLRDLLHVVLVVLYSGPATVS